MGTRDTDLPGFDGDDEGRGPQPTPVDWAKLALHCVLRRKALSIAVFLLGVGAAVAYYALKRPLYRVEAVILAQRQQSVPSNVRPTMEDVPTRSAWELVHRRENLVALVKLAGLEPAKPAKPAKAHRGPLDRLRDIGAREDPGVEEDPLDTFVRVLDKRLSVVVDDRTIAISIDWPDPTQAHQIVNGALQNFIEARHLQEVTAIDEVISALRGRVATARDNLQQTVETVQRETAERRVSGAWNASQRSADARPGEELERITSMLEAKRRAIADVEEFRRRRLADLQAQLDERRGVYSEAHPSVIGLRQDIQALSRESPQIAALREEEGQLRKQYLARLAAAPAASRGTSGTAPGAPSGSGSGAGAPRTNASAEDDERVMDARFQYQQMVERVNAAQLELDAVRAAFKYRYNVIWPPQMPREPVSPDPLKTLGFGGLASILLALASAAAPDVLRGRIVERWQVERMLGLPVLGELKQK
jgi:uncharacterized protein involved in exopolysaccharide biosynthesis